MTPLGHRWLLFDEDERDVGVSRRGYHGVAKLLYRLVVLVGMSAGNDIRVAVRDADGTQVAELYSRTGATAFSDTGKPKLVEVADGKRQPLGVARRDLEAEFVLEDASGTEVGRIVFDPETGGFPIIDVTGTRVAVLTTVRPKPRSSAAALLDLFDWETTPDPQALHGAPSFYVVLDAQPIAEPLRTMAILSPVIAAYAH